MTRLRRVWPRARPLAAALLAAGAVVLLAGELLAAPRGRTIEGVSLVSGTTVIEANNSPDVLRNPQRPENLVVVNRVDRPTFSAVVSSSGDGGQSWIEVVPPLPEGTDRPFAPDAAFAPNGDLYVAYVNLVGRGNRPENLWIARSQDGGATFADPVRVTGEHPFQAQLTADPETGTLYMTWLQADSLGLLAFREPLPRIVVSRSSDGGRTWSPPVAVSDRTRPRVGAAVPVVLPGGEVVVVYRDFKGDVRDFGNLEGPAWHEPFSLVATRSPDGGRTFSTGVEFESGAVPVRRFLPFLPELPSVAAGADGGLVVTWADGRNGDLDVFLRQSEDGGASWTDPVRVNPNRLHDGTSQYLPAVDIAPDGRIDVLYLDRSVDPTDEEMHATLASSWDGGRTFDAVHLSPQPFDSRIGASAAPYLEPDFGTRLGVDSMPDDVYAVWTDTGLSSVSTGRQDIAGARVAVTDRGGLAPRFGPPTGLMVVATVLLLRSRRPAAPAGQRRRDPDHVGPGAVDEHPGVRR